MEFSTLPDSLFVPPVGGRTTIVQIRDEEMVPLYDVAWFEGATLGLMLMWLVVVCSYRSVVRMLLGKLDVRKLNFSRPSYMVEVQSGEYTRMLWWLVVLGWFVLGLFTARLVGVVGWEPATGAVVMGAGVAITLFQLGLLRVSGAVTLTQRLSLHLIALKFNYVGLAALVIAPAMLLFMLTPPEVAHEALYGIVAGAGILGVMYLRETLTLFATEKIPILHWFLYLCAVEIFPVSWVWLYAAKW